MGRVVGSSLFSWRRATQHCGCNITASTTSLHLDDLVFVWHLCTLLAWARWHWKLLKRFFLGLKNEWRVIFCADAWQSQWTKSCVGTLKFLLKSRVGPCYGIHNHDKVVQARLMAKLFFASNCCSASSVHCFLKFNLMLAVGLTETDSCEGGWGEPFSPKNATAMHSVAMGWKP